MWQDGKLITSSTIEQNEVKWVKLIITPAISEPGMCVTVKIDTIISLLGLRMRRGKETSLDLILVPWPNDDRVHFSALNLELWGGTMNNKPLLSRSDH